MCNCCVYELYSKQLDRLGLNGCSSNGPSKALWRLRRLQPPPIPLSRNEAGSSSEHKSMLALIGNSGVIPRKKRKKRTGGRGRNAPRSIHCDPVSEIPCCGASDRRQSGSCCCLSAPCCCSPGETALILSEYTRLINT